MGFPPQITHFNRIFHYKPSILGYHYFWKHPYIVPYKNPTWSEELPNWLKNVAKDSCPENGTPLSPDNLKVDFQKTYYKSIMIGFDLLILCRVRKIKQTSEEKQKMMYTSKNAEEAKSIQIFFNVTLLGTNISPKNGILKMIFLFPRWDMLIPWRVFPQTAMCLFF